MARQPEVAGGIQTAMIIAAALIEGFNQDITLTRTQTIMQGAPFCNFRYVAQTSAAEK